VRTASSSPGRSPPGAVLDDDAGSGALIASAPARIITTASDAHKGRQIPFDDVNAARSYRSRGYKRYGKTKLANILFTVELARRLRSTGVTANCFHPGLVATGWNRNNGPLMSAAMSIARPFSRSPRKGAETLVWLAESPAVSDETGGYFVDKRRTMPSAPAQDADAARRLWELSEAQTRLPPTPESRYAALDLPRRHHGRRRQESSSTSASFSNI